MDIKETSQLNKVEQLNELIKEVSIDSSLIRTMAKDMANLKEKQPEKSKVVPPVGLPILSSSKPKIKEIKVKGPNIFLRIFRFLRSKSIDIKRPQPPIIPKLKPLEIKTASRQIKSVSITLISVVIIVVVGLGGFFYWWNYVRVITPIIPVIEPITEPKPITEPESLILTAFTETIELIAGQENLLLGQLGVLAAQEQEINAFKRILVKLTNQTETKYIDLNTLMLSLGISIPEPIMAAVNQGSDNHTLFFYNQLEGNRLGLVIKMGESETLVQDLKTWEMTVFNDIKSMILIDGIPTPATEGFQDNIYQDIYIRYMNFATPDLSLDYGLVAGNLVLSTSRESMFAIIDVLLSE